LPPAPEVDVARPVVQENVEWDEYTGRLAAIEAVDVRARVDGYLDKIHFKAGQIVKKGDLLFTIDPRPFEADLKRAKAQVVQAQAELDHAEYELQRIQGLQKQEVAPEKEYRDVLFAERNARAAVDRALASERIAALNVEWSAVVAPISGRISRELVTVGNLIHDGANEATLLTTIVSLDPIYCYFDADEQAYLKYTRMAKSGERASSREHANPVRVALFDEQDFVHEGHMAFVDNVIDQRTGTIRARAVLPNPDGLLIPGLFVRVRLIGSGMRPMIYVPDAAIVTNQTSRMVLLVDGKNLVHQRPVIIGRLQNGLRRVMSGLDGSETIVVGGVQRARPNAEVKPNPVPICPKDWVPDPAVGQRTTTPPTSQPSDGVAS
jgi:multidrug efflux system membrane fusion protein